ncbi:nuclear transport factor 2 family protein [Echria macrotheca]|uniref:Nuclear transport factor 2 family protein n=1 Tax=Echria macrotheca TaxID=438768 RepID=A0AAJ0B8P5_9PEZI|nr:nuclear transport factor 2 family protein [Echria macrotheca]
MANSTDSAKAKEHIAMLRYLYADLKRISKISSSDIILHPADRDLCSPPKRPVRGIAAVQAHEEALIEATGGTLVMEVDKITASDDFGTVLGTLRASKPGRGEVEVAFCGVWRFKDGLAVEHWENAANPGKLVEWLVGC